MAYRGMGALPPTEARGDVVMSPAARALAAARREYLAAGGTSQVYTAQPAPVLKTKDIYQTAGAGTPIYNPSPVLSPLPTSFAAPPAAFPWMKVSIVAALGIGAIVVIRALKRRK